MHSVRSKVSVISHITKTGFVSDVYSTSSVRDLTNVTRKCLFANEGGLVGLEHFKNYTRSNCLVECGYNFFMKECECVPYYYPSTDKSEENRLYFAHNPLSSVRGKDWRVCGLRELPCLSKASKEFRKLAFPPDDLLKKLNDMGMNCMCPSCKAKAYFYGTLLIYSLCH